MSAWNRADSSARRWWCWAPLAEVLPHRGALRSQAGRPGHGGLGVLLPSGQLLFGPCDPFAFVSDLLLAGRGFLFPVLEALHPIGPRVPQVCDLLLERLLLLTQQALFRFERRLPRPMLLRLPGFFGAKLRGLRLEDFRGLVEFRLPG